MEKKQSKKTWNLFSLVVLLLLAAAEAVFMLRIWKLKMLPGKYFLLLAGAVLLFTGLICLLLFQKKGGKWQKSVSHGKQIAGYLLCAVIIGLCLVGQTAIGQVQGTIDTITAPQKVSVVLEIYVRSDDPAEFLQDTAGYTFALPQDITEAEIQPVLQELEELLGQNFSTAAYPNAAAQLDALLSGEADALVLNSAYLTILREEEEYAEIDTRLKLLHEKVVEKEVTYLPPIPNRDVKSEELDISEDAFLMYISGIDGRHSVNSVGRSDVNILVVANLETHQILMINTPRDYYIVNPAGGDGAWDKLTHCGVAGIENSVAAISHLYGWPIDYYAKINFTGLETLIDAIGGVTVYSEHSFNAAARYPIHKGENHLNGEEALAFARERKRLPGGDNDRGKNQMRLIEGIVNQLSAGNLLANYGQILESLEGMFTTSMPAEEIGRVIQLQLSQMPQWEIRSFAVTGDNDVDHCWASGWYSYVMKPHEQVVQQASDLIEKVMTGQLLTDEDLILSD